MTGIQGALLVYGPLGLMVLLGIYASIKMFLILSAERKEFTSEFKKLNESHKEELLEREDRYIAKAEKWMEQYHELATSMNEVLHSLLKRIRREE